MKIDSLPNTTSGRLSVAVAMTSFNENMIKAISADTKEETEKNFEAMLNAAIVVSTRTTYKAYDDVWVINARNMSESIVRTLNVFAKRKMEINQTLTGKALVLTAYIDSAICFMVKNETDGFARMMATLGQITYWNSKGVERIQRMAKENPEMFNLKDDPDCTMTTKLLNIMLRNGVETADEMDINGCLSDILRFSDYKVAQAYADRMAKKNPERGTTISLDNNASGITLAISLTNREIMEKPYYVSLMTLDGMIEILSYLRENAEGGDKLDPTPLERMKEVREKVKDGKSETYYTNFKPYVTNFDSAYDQIVSYDLGPLVFEDCKFTDNAKAVLGFLTRRLPDSIRRILEPEARDDMYIEKVDWFCNISLTDVILDAIDHVRNIDVDRLK